MKLAFCLSSCPNVRLSWISSVAVDIVIAAFLLISPRSVAKQGNEKMFASPRDAVLATYNAVKSNDQQALRASFGANAVPILHTGEDVADKKWRTISFVVTTR